MVPKLRRYRWRLVGAGLLFGLAVAAWFGWRWLDRYEGNSEEVFARLRVGMSQQEAVEVLATFDSSSGQYSWGVTTDGREFGSLHLHSRSMDDLPPPQEIESCVMSDLDNDGREIEVTLGPGGTVSGKRLTPGVWEYRWDKAYRALRDKPYGALLSKYWSRYRHIAFGLTAGLVLASAWMLRRRAARRCPA